MDQSKKWEQAVVDRVDGVWKQNMGDLETRLQAAQVRIEQVGQYHMGRLVRLEAGLQTGTQHVGACK